MEDAQDEDRHSQGIITTVASPTVLAAILDESIDKQTLQALENSPQAEKCLDDSEPEKKTSLEMNEGEKQNNFVGSFVEDSLEYDDASQDHERRKLNENLGASISDTSSLVEGTLREYTEDKTKDSKPLNKAVKNKQTYKQKPRETNFIDLNKDKLIRRMGKGGYAAMHSQKIQQKQDTTKNKDSAMRERGQIEQREKESTLNNELSRQYSYSNIQERTSSLSNPHAYPTHQHSSYYNVDGSYLPGTYDYTSTVNQSELGYNGYLTQPYHAPYRDFGLRYSNHGHQYYMASGAAASHRYPDDQTQGYSSHSAPPGIHGRQLLLNQVEFFPEQEEYLSQSLTNSQFMYPWQMYHTDSDLERRFVSEPQLSHGNVKDNKNVNAVNASPKPADYKPYTLKDYRQIKNEQLDTLGSLGPDTESDDYKEKITKLNKQREYAEMLRIDHAARKKQWAKKPGVPLPTARHLQAEAKRQAAINYSKTVPKPKSTDVAKHHKEPNQVKAENNDKDVPLIEVLRMRHVQEKHHIEAIRKQLTAKTSHI